MLLGLSLPLELHQAAWTLLALVAAPLVAILGHRETMQPVRELVRRRGLRSAHETFVAAYTGLFVIQFLAPFFLQQQYKMAPSTVGLVLVALPAATALVGPVSGWLSDSIGARATAVAGAVIAVVGTTLLAPLSGGWGVASIAWRLAGVGAGFGLLSPPTQAFALEEAGAALRATASATTNLARQVGIAVGPGLATVTWSLEDYTSTGMRWGLVVASFAAIGAVTCSFQLVPEQLRSRMEVP